ncbi:MAG: glycosyltransferase [Sumerlaeia bacterium]
MTLSAPASDPTSSYEPAAETVAAGPLAILFHRFGPYHRARIEGAAQFGPVLAIEMSSRTSVYAWDPVELSGDVRRETLFKDSDSREQDFATLYARIDQVLSEARPCAVAVNGWSDNGALASLLWCRKNAVPAIVMSETQERDFARVGWKEWIKRRIVGGFSAGFGGGHNHTAYLAKLGLPRDSLFIGYDAVDNAHFREKSAAARQDPAAARATHGIPERPFILTSNRFIEKKNLARVLDAFALYRKEAPQTSRLWDLVLLGDGDLRADLEARVAEHGLQDHVHFCGFRQYDELPAWYGLTDLFLHASTTEQWGLVVNEAMAAGLPVVVSEACGSSELVADGESGYRFDPLEMRQLADILLKMAADPEKLSAMGERGAELIADYSPATFGEGIWRAVEAARRNGAKPLNFLDALIVRYCHPRS